MHCHFHWSKHWFTQPDVCYVLDNAEKKQINIVTAILWQLDIFRIIKPEKKIRIVSILDVST